jgi:hypothetical protein
MVKINRITKNTLFNKAHLSELLGSKRNQLTDLIESWQEDLILKNDEI